MHVVRLSTNDGTEAGRTASVELLRVCLGGMDGESRFDNATRGVNQNRVRRSDSSETSHCAKPGVGSLAYGTSTGGN